MATWSTRFYSSSSYTTLVVEATESNVNQTNNTSLVTVKAYIEKSSSSSGTTYDSSNSSKLTVKINGVTKANAQTFNYSVSSGGRDDLGTWSQTVTHNADGSKTVNIFVQTQTSEGTSNINQSLTLTNIPRETKTMNSGKNWAYGKNTAISVSRASSSFTHKIDFSIYNTSTNSWDFIGTTDEFGTSTTWVQSSTHLARIAATVKASGYPSSLQSKCTIHTYNGSTKIGTADVTGTFSNIPYPNVTSSNFNIGTNPTVTLNSVQSGFTYQVTWNFGTLKKTNSYTSGGNQTFTFTSTDNTSMYNILSTAKSGWGTYSIIALYNGVQVRTGASSGSITAYVVDSNPTLNNTFTFLDSNSATTAITGNNQILIQNKSTLQVTIPASMGSARNGATAKQYIISVGGQEIVQTYTTSAITVNFGTVSAGSNSSITVELVDSRGNATAVSKSVTIYPYANPTIYGSLLRENGFDSVTAIKATGTIATVNGLNAITNIQYRSKLESSGTWGAWASLTPTLTNGIYGTSTVNGTFDNSSKFNFQFSVTDKLGTVIVQSLLLDSGKPIMFVDKAHKSVGIGKFPDNNNSLEVEGNLLVEGNSTTTGNLDVDGLISTASVFPLITSLTSDSVSGNVVPDGLTLFDGGSTSGYPDNYGVGMNIRVTDNRQAQMYFGQKGNNLFYRGWRSADGTAGEWSTWKRVYDNTYLPYRYETNSNGEAWIVTIPTSNKTLMICRKNFSFNPSTADNYVTFSHSYGNTSYAAYVSPNSNDYVNMVNVSCFIAAPNNGYQIRLYRTRTGTSGTSAGAVLITIGYL